MTITPIARASLLPSMSVDLGQSQPERLDGSAMKRLPLIIALGAMLASLTGFTQQDADEHAAHHSEEQAAAPPSPPSMTIRRAVESCRRT